MNFSVSEAIDYLYLVAGNKLPEPYKNLCSYVLDNKKFKTAMGGITRHHSYQGGLAVHTADVLYRCLSMASENLQLDTLITAAIWHDFHKIYEYEWDDDKSEGVSLPYRKLIGHLVGSYSECMMLMTLNGFSSEERLKVGHCMLSHHGRHEWRSPVEPRTPEAFILHAADMQSMAEDAERTKSTKCR